MKRTTRKTTKGRVTASRELNPRTADQVLADFDRTQANLKRLESLWSKLESLMPPGGLVLSQGPDPRGFDDARRAFVLISRALPSIDGFRVAAEPATADEIFQSRLELARYGDPEDFPVLDRQIDAPERELSEYRFRFDLKRRELVRQLAHRTFNAINDTLAGLSRRWGQRAAPTTPVRGPKWLQLEQHLADLERLVGDSVPRVPQWSDMYRHLHFGLVCDLRDIVEKDFPAIRASIDAALYSENEPIPVGVPDLGELVTRVPDGRITAKLAWSTLDAEGFERLLFDLLSDAGGYEGVQWLMKTNAPDRGRDLSATRVHSDSLAGVQRRRIVVQCKHWQARTVAVKALAEATAQMKLWEPPPVEVLVVATTGRFSADAVAWAEKRSESPALELWPESHLERLLARRPYLIAQHRLAQI